MKKIAMIKNLSPLNHSDTMSTTAYILKKVLAFFMIYGISAIVGEAIIIGLLNTMGYDPLHGIMPAGQWGTLLPYYGFAMFLLVTILYCRLVEKRNIESLGYSKKITDYFSGGILAVLLLAIIIGLCCFAKAISWEGINENSNIAYILCLWIGFFIQSTAEETMSRGFLLQTLLKKTSAVVAILVSSTAFAFPHFFSLFEAETKYAVLGVINLYLISIIFSLFMLIRSNIWIACGLHGTWNFILYGIMGLSLSGSENNSEGIMLFKTNSLNILNGGSYGIEAGIITTVILGVVVVLLLIKYRKDRRLSHGI